MRKKKDKPEANRGESLVANLTSLPATRHPFLVTVVIRRMVFFFFGALRLFFVSRKRGVTIYIIWFGIK